MNKQKIVGMNTRLKTHISRLSLFLPSMTSQKSDHKSGSIVQIYQDEKRSFSIVMSQFLNNSQEALPIGSQLMHMVVRDETGEYFSPDFGLEEAKEQLNDLAALFGGFTLFTENKKHITSIVFPILKKHLFDVDFIEDDKETFLTLFNKNKVEYQNSVANKQNANDDLSLAQKRFNAEFANLSQQDKIDALTSVLERLQKEEDKLKESLSKKHNIAHLSNLKDGQQANSFTTMKKNYSDAAKIIHENNLSVDFRIIEDLHSKKEK